MNRSVPERFAAIAPNAPGDFNGDLSVNGADFLAWQRKFGDTLDADDLGDWQDNFGSDGTVAASSATVPEPSSAVLLAIAFGVLGIVRRRATR